MSSRCEVCVVLVPALRRTTTHGLPQVVDKESGRIVASAYLNKMQPAVSKL